MATASVEGDEGGGARAGAAAPPELWRPAWDWDVARMALEEAEPALRPALAVPLPPRPARSVFGQLVRAICAQQVSVAAADTFERRLVAGCGGRLTAQALAGLGDEGLRGAGLSGAKARYVRALAEAALRGELDPEAWAGEPDEDVVERLTALPGVGRWTGEMVLLFGLHRPDVWPAGDLGIRAAVALLDGGGAASGGRGGGATALPPPRAVAARADAWRPHRSTATLALWAWRRSLRAPGAAAQAE